MFANASQFGAGLYAGPPLTLSSIASGNLELALSNGAPAWLCSVRVLYTCTATVGNRIPMLRLLDGPAPANILHEAAVGFAITANQVARLNFGSGALAAQMGTWQAIPLPVNILLPQFSFLTMIDAAGIDGNDTVQQVAATYAM